MRSMMLQIVAVLSLAAVFASGSALASNELAMQKVASDSPILLASGSHNPCAHHDNDKKAKNPCAHHGNDKKAKNPCGHHDNDKKAKNACNPCASNPCSKSH